MDPVREPVEAHPGDPEVVRHEPHRPQHRHLPDPLAQVLLGAALSGGRERRAGGGGDTGEHHLAHPRSLGRVGQGPPAGELQLLVDARRPEGHRRYGEQRPGPGQRRAEARRIVEVRDGQLGSGLRERHGGGRRGVPHQRAHRTSGGQQSSGRRPALVPGGAGHGDGAPGGVIGFGGHVVLPRPGLCFTPGIWDTPTRLTPWVQGVS